VDVAIALLTLALLALVVRFLSGPLRERVRGADEGGPGGEEGHAGQAGTGHSGAGDGADAEGAPRDPGELQALEAAREAKYREIRDCELDFRTGKLSREDYEAIDSALRAEAIEILNRLERSGA